MMRELQNVSVVSQSISDQIISFPQVGEGCPKEGGNCRTGEDMDGRFRDFYSLRQESVDNMESKSLQKLITFVGSGFILNYQTTPIFFSCIVELCVAWTW